MDGCATLELLDAALGPPLARHTLRADGRFAGAIARWRHAGAEVDFASADTLQLLFNVSGGQRVEASGRPASPPVRAGSVTLVDTAAAPTLRVRGEADTLQIVLPRRLVLQARRANSLRLAGPERRRRAQALAARALLALADAASAPDKAASVIREAATLAAHGPSEPAKHGGLGPSAHRRVTALAEARLARAAPLSVGEMAEEARLAPHHFIRAFHATEGLTPHAWLTARRVDEALRRLLEGRERIGELADACGFASPAHFVSVFRTRLGVTPGRLREAARLSDRPRPARNTAIS